MPLFFFNFTDSGKALEGDPGLEFDSFEEACLEGHRGLTEVSLEMVRQHLDPSRQTLEITDASGARVLFLTFSDLLRPRSAPRPGPSVIDAIRARRSRQKQLRSDLAEQIASAQQAVITTRGLLRLSGKEQNGQADD